MAVSTVVLPVIAFYPLAVDRLWIGVVDLVIVNMNAPRTHRQMVGRQVGPGQMVVLFPASSTPEDADPFIGARSPDGAWRVVAHLHLADDGTFFVRDLEVTPWDGSPMPLSTDTLRRLPLGRWTTQAHASLAGRARKGVAAGRGGEQLSRLAGSTVAPKVGPRGFGRDYYRRLALDYLDLQAKGVSRGIREELAFLEGLRQKRRITTTNIRDGLTKATELGFLTPGHRGRAGRQPGPNLYVNDKEGATDGQ